MISYRITGLPATTFAHLFGLSDTALAAESALRYIVDAKPGFPDRVEMRDLEVGERALLVNYVHQSSTTPYRASHAIFVREGAIESYDRVNEVPDVMRLRLLALRSFDAGGMMLDADIVEGKQIETVIDRLFENSEAAYLHAHYAKRGCFAARIDRV